MDNILNFAFENMEIIIIGVVIAVLIGYGFRGARRVVGMVATILITVFVLGVFGVPVKEIATDVQDKMNDFTNNVTGSHFRKIRAKGRKLRAFADELIATTAYHHVGFNSWSNGGSSQERITEMLERVREEHKAFLNKYNKC